MNITTKKGRSGVYCVMNMDTGQVYVGSSSVCLRTRMLKIRLGLIKGDFHNPFLVEAWQSYGKERFEFFVIEYCDPKETFSRETRWIRILDATSRESGYNIYPTAGSTHGASRPEVGKKISQSHKNRPEAAKAATSQKIRVAQTGRRASPETRAKMSESHRGRRHSEETKRKLSKIHTGMKHSEEARRKMSISQSIRKRREFEESVLAS